MPPVTLLLEAASHALPIAALLAMRFCRCSRLAHFGASRGRISILLVDREQQVIFIRRRAWCSAEGAAFRRRAHLFNSTP
jgi:hypothetical protein